MAITRDTIRLINLLRATVGRISDDVTRGLVAAWARTWDELAPDMVAAISELLAAASGTGAWPSRRQILKARRILLALNQSEQALERLAAKAVRDVPNAALLAAQASADGQGPIVASQLPYGSALERAARHHVFQADQLDAIVRRTAEQITARTRPLSADATEAMKRELIRGIAVGANPREAGRRMVARVEGAFNGGLTRATAIARTEMLDASRQAAEISQADHADVLDGWRWHCDLSLRTCPACLAMHGTVHPLSEPGPNDHVNGRCARVPITKSWRDLGIDIDEPEDVFPDAQAWFAGLSRADQLQIMGPGRLDLLDSGQIAWSDLPQLRTADGWRDSHVTRPVADLRRIAA